MTRSRKIVLGSAGLLILVMAGGFWMVSPKYRTATSPEIRAVVDPALLVPLPNAADGKARYEQVEAALEEWQSHSARPIPGMPSPSSRVAPQLLDLQNGSVKKIDEILRSGPIYRWSETNASKPFVAMTSLRSLAKQAVEGANDRAFAGDWNGATADLLFGYRLLKALRESDASQIDYLVTEAIEGILEAGTLRLAANPSMTISFAQEILAAMPPTENVDRPLQHAIAGEFQGYALPRLPDPWAWGDKNGTMFDDMMGDEDVKRDNHIGSYDPIASAKLESELAMEQLTNAGLKKSQQKFDVLTKIEKMQKPLPEAPANGSSMKDDLKWRWFAFRMNLIPNSLGLLNIGGSLTGRHLLDLSLRSRTNRERTRAALTVAIFRKRFGHDPANFTDVVKARLLNEVPFDYQTDTPLPFDLDALFTWPKNPLFSTPRP